jgi:hypothetical protein
MRVSHRAVHKDASTWYEAMRQGSHLVGRRRAVEPLIRTRRGFTPWFPSEGQLPGFFCSHPSSNPSVVPCVSVFGPSQVQTIHISLVLWPLLTPASPSRLVALPVAAGSQRQKDRPHDVSIHSFAPLPPDILRAGLGNPGFHCPTPAHPPLQASYPIARFRVILFVGSWLWLRLPLDPASRRRPCLRLMVSIPYSIEDLHLRE